MQINNDPRIPLLLADDVAQVGGDARQKPAKRDFGVALYQLRVSRRQEKRYSIILGEYIFRTRYRTKLALAYLVAVAVLLETYLKIKSAWHDFRDRQA
ncbi:MAG: hypothetical protein KF715_10720 [Candidatus Didemnitutus sp.]|nr:hypothetical protein [Candidatus Didemnitutus sp.]